MQAVTEPDVTKDVGPDETPVESVDVEGKADAMGKVEIEDVLHGGCSNKTNPLISSHPGSPKLKQRQRPRRGRGRVHWDEQAIAEHDKERGTRQKIDEPDTPFVRSPQTASDSESNEDQGRGGHRRAQWASASQATASGDPQGADSPSGDVDPRALASRLDFLISSGGAMRRTSTGSSVNSSDAGECWADRECTDRDYVADNSRISSACSSRSSSSAPFGRPRAVASDDAANGEGGSAEAKVTQPSRHADRRISLPDESPVPKPASASFREKRAKHYNEAHALKKACARTFGASSTESSGTTSDEDFPEVKTNTNTNINKTTTTMFRPDSSVSSRHSGENAHSLGALPAPNSLPASSSGTPRVRSSRGVSFSEGSGAESADEFRAQRRNSETREWRRDSTVSSDADSVETNTNTNRNAGSKVNEGARERKNPSEPRPSVRLAGDENTSADAVSSGEFRARRQNHYNEIEVLRKFRAENVEDEEHRSSSSDDGNPIVFQDCGESVPSNDGNPMEPRESGVLILVPQNSQEAERIQSSTRRDAPSTSNSSSYEWAARRQAHYSEMASAFRSAPPASDDDESTDGDA